MPVTVAHHHGNRSITHRIMWRIKDDFVRTGESDSARYYLQDADFAPNKNTHA
jgi:hypothetical protein